MQAVVQVLIQRHEPVPVLVLLVVALEGWVGDLDKRLGLVQEVAQAGDRELGCGRLGSAWAHPEVGNGEALTKRVLLRRSSPFDPLH